MNESERAIERAHASERAKRAGEQSRECMNSEKSGGQQLCKPANATTKTTSYSLRKRTMEQNRVKVTLG
jgi:hypothetical protein